MSIILFFKNYGKIPPYIKKIINDKKKEKQAEGERIQAIKPPLRYIPEEERNQLLTVGSIILSLLYEFSVLTHSTV